MKKFIKIIKTVCTILIVANCCSAFGMNSNLPVMPSNNKESNARNVVVIADPAYDSTFKYIFANNKDLDGSKDRLMSLLNAVFYPNAAANAEKIQEVQFLTNSTELGSLDGAGALNFDIACKCTVYATTHNLRNTLRGTKYSFDVEMQTGGSGIELYPRLLQYGHAMRSSCSDPVKVLAFFNPQPNVKSAFCDAIVKPAIFNIENEEFIKEVNNNMDVFVLDLRKIARKLQDKQDITIKGTKLGKDAEDWLSLLSIRQWGDSDGAGRYKIPMEDSYTTAGVKSAVTLLTDVSDATLMNAVNRENAANNLLKSSEQKGAEQERAILQPTIDDLKRKRIVSVFKKGKKLFKSNPDFEFVKSSELTDDVTVELVDNSINAKKPAKYYQWFIYGIKANNYLPHFSSSESGEE